MSKIWIHKTQTFTKNGKAMVCESDAEKGTIDRGWMEGLSKMLREGWTPGEVRETEVIQHYSLPKLKGVRL
jgi:hypothetical protein